MNLDCFNTFIESADKANVDFEILLVESNKDSLYKYPIDQVSIITPKSDFNFHKFLNIGVEQAKGDYLILSNNDVVFDVNWLIEINKVIADNPNILSFSPLDPKANKTPKVTLENNSYILGYQIQKHITGWCIITHKKVFNSIQKLDERFEFYYADNDYAMQLQKYNIKHALVTNAIVHHLHGQSSKSQASQENFKLPKKTPAYILKENWTWVLGNEKMVNGLIVFHDKWGGRKIIKVKLYIAKVLAKIGLGYFNRFIITHT
jgi:GT2 family glycosyltransferase